MRNESLVKQMFPPASFNWSLSCPTESSIVDVRTKLLKTYVLALSIDICQYSNEE